MKVRQTQFNRVIFLSYKINLINRRNVLSILGTSVSDFVKISFKMSKMKIYKFNGSYYF